MKSVFSRVVKVLLPLLLGGAILFWMYRDFDFERVRQVVLHEMSWTWMLLSLPFCVLAQAMRGWRWRQTLEPVGEHPRTHVVVCSIFVSYAVSLVVPRIGEFMRCAILRRWDGVSFPKAIGTVVTERAVGTELSFTATDVTFIRLNGEKDKLSDLNFTITVGEPDDGRLKFDENAASLPAYTAGDKADVTMKRTIKGGEWSTICLPFTLPKAKAEAAFGADAKYYKFSGFETTVDVDGDMIPTAIQLNFTEHKLTSSLSSISGGTPYLVKTTQDVTEIKVDQVKLVAAVEPTTVEDVNYDVLGGKFTGTFVKTKVPSDGLFISGDQFWYSTGNTNIKAFRAWFDLDVVLNKEIELSRITMNFVDDDTTGITNTNSTNDTNEWYTVSGVKVEKPVRKGLYIQNGKKKVVK